MTLLGTAASDLRSILEDTTSGFSLSMTVTNPAGASATITGLASDIGQQIDPDTGQVVSGRTLHATLPLAALADAGLGQPKGIPDESSKPWLVALQLPSATAPETFIVTQTMPDRLGCLVCFLKLYTPAP